MDKTKMSSRNKTIATMRTEGFTVDQIASKFDLSVYRVRAILSELGVVVGNKKGSKNGDRNSEMLATWKEGKSLKDLSVEYDLSDLRIASLLIREMETERAS